MIPMDEFDEAVVLANRVLHPSDSDGDICLLARQFLRTAARAERAEREYDELWERLEQWRESEAGEPDDDLCDFMDRWLKHKAAMRP